MSGQALIIGKFYPPHAGHHFLIDTALSECQHLMVLVLAHPSETISGALRAAWLREVHQEAGDRLTVISAPCDLPVDYNSRDADRAHADLIFKTLTQFDHILASPSWWPKRLCLYSSEEYGPRIAGDLQDLANARLAADSGHCFTVEHRMVDQGRIARPVSASDVRARPVENWKYLAGPVRRSLTKRFVVCGAESTGTTTLARALAERYQTVWVPEWGRLFSEATGSHHCWSTHDFEEIIAEQWRLEQRLAEHAGPVMFCDTDGYATLMFHRLYMRSDAPLALWDRVRDTALTAPRSRYFITSPEGVPYEQDGYRLFPEQREWADDWFISHLPGEVGDLDTNVNIVTGDRDERLAYASWRVTNDMTWSFGPAGDEL